MDSFLFRQVSSGEKVHEVRESARYSREQAATQCDGGTGGLRLPFAYFSE
ncbi:hypothetical protein CaCOL14_010731 [Colletotrichum acutatum]